MKTKARPKFNPDCQKNAPKVSYICDGHGCDRNCSDMRPEEWAAYKCHHTTDEKHAVNKIRRNRKFKCEKDDKGVVKGYREIER